MRYVKPLLLLAAVVAGGYGVYLHLSKPAATPMANAAHAGNQLPSDTVHPVPLAVTLDTPHYRIASTATAVQTARVGEAAELLYRAYADFFPTPTAHPARKARLSLVLYRDRQEFKAHNRSKPWAEAYYLAPSCHAYYAEGQPNPVHWMLHEATHQLSREVSGFPKTRWVDEGLATYFGTSRIEQGALRPGDADPNAYPLWWLPQLALTGDLQQDLRAGRLIPLRDLIAGTGPDIGGHVNTYYLQFWSLTHFLFHHDGGRYAAGYRTLIARGGSLADFEALIGPVERIQREWYHYLQRLRTSVATANAHCAVPRPDIATVFIRRCYRHAA